MGLVPGRWSTGPAGQSSCQASLGSWAHCNFVGLHIFKVEIVFHQNIEQRDFRFLGEHLKWGSNYNIGPMKILHTRGQLIQSSATVNW